MQQACALISGFVVLSFEIRLKEQVHTTNPPFQGIKVPVMLLFNKLSCLNLGTSNFWNGRIYILQRQWFDLSKQ